MTKREMLNEELEWLVVFRKICADRGADPEQVRKNVRKIRSRIAGLQNGFVDTLAKPLTEEWRHVVSEDGESGADYVIFADCGETDDEIQEYVDNEIGYAPIGCGYDCTGRLFTTSKYWGRTNAGIVIVHRWAVDV